MGEAGSLYFRNPIVTDDAGADHGDPFVLNHNGKYYMYHTGKEGIKLYISDDMANWEFEGVAINVNDAPEHWAQYELWAPEVMYFAGVFYMYVTGTKRLGPTKGDDQARRLGIARSENPEGPFVWDPAPLVPWEWSIDGHPFRDDDGSLWLFYNIRTEASRYHDGTTGCGNVVDRLLAPDQLEGIQAAVAYPTERWEGNAEGTWYWNEGPFVLKRHGVYYQMYSGGCFRDGTYAVGYATATAPRGPWTKFSGNPILKSQEGILGPGHHCIVKAPDGVTPYIIYHGYLPGQRGRKVHADRLFWAGDRLILTGPTVDDQSIPPGPVYDPAVPYWHMTAWVTGRNMLVSGVSVDLNSAAVIKVEAVYATTLRIFVDGIKQHEGIVQNAKPKIESDGSVQNVAVTSWLDDETIYELSGGQSRKWLWGGTSGVEVSLGILGSAVISAQGSISKQIAVDAIDKYEHVWFSVPQGVDYIEVTAGQDGAKVTDVVLTARKLVATEHAADVTDVKDALNT